MSSSQTRLLQGALDLLRQRLSQARSLWRNWFHRRQVEEDLDAEVRAYAGLLVQENIRHGMTLEEARRAAFIELEGIEQLKEQVRDVR
jgi:hypothetical protein